MSVREIIKIDEELCNGCGECIPNCPEGALQIIDDKARLVSDLFCDGLGACVGHCPTGAMTVEKREAEEYEERKVMANIVKAGPNTVKAHLLHLKDHGAHDFLHEALAYLQEEGLDIPDGVLPDHHPLAQEAGAQEAGCGGAGGDDLPCGCPGSAVMDFSEKPQAEAQPQEAAGPVGSRPSQLRQWPVQLMLVPPGAPYFNGSNLVIAADCVPFAYPDFHEDFLKDRTLLIGCPKLDDAQHYQEKLTAIFKQNDIRSVVVAFMEVPCCFGLVHLVQSAIQASGKAIPFAKQMIGVKGDKKE